MNFTDAQNESSDVNFYFVKVVTHKVIDIYIYNSNTMQFVAKYFMNTPVIQIKLAKYTHKT